MNWFTDQALEQCRKTAMVYADAMPISGKALEQGLQWLAQAQRLRLGMPLIPHDKEEHVIAKLSHFGYGVDAPYQVTVVEYEHGGAYDVKQDYTRALSTRRIALCVVVSDEQAPMAAHAAQGRAGHWGSLLVWPISYFDEKREWEFSPGVVLVPRDQAHQQVAHAENPYLALSHAAESWLRRRLPGVGRQQDDTPMTVSYQPMMPELCAKLGQEHADKMIRESAMDALWVTLGAFTAMGCGNVFIDRERRSLRMRMPSGERVDLDPFRGHRAMAWNGRGVWTQGSTFHREKASAEDVAA